VGLFTSNDTEVVAQLLAVPLPGIGISLNSLVNFIGTVKNDPQWIERIANFMRQVEGAYALTILTQVNCGGSDPNIQDAIYGVRDRFGNRPLCLGQTINTDGTITYEFLLAWLNTQVHPRFGVLCYLHNWWDFSARCPTWGDR
jgi:glutamine phosphoribosylpyrophosphate amidotransferase